MYRFLGELRRVNISVYAANACFFLVLAAFPMLMVLLAVLRYTPLEPEYLGQLAEGVLPEAFGAGARRLILLAREGLSGAALSLTAVTALWSASRGIYGIITGLNAVYGVTENRGYVRKRLISVVYLLLFLLVLVLTLALHVFGTGLLDLLYRLPIPVLDVLMRFIDFRFFLLLILQTAVFTAMFMALPNRKNSLKQSLPGALLAASGWLIFSDVYSVYVERFARVKSFGPLSALAPAMLWLYFCMNIVLCGGALNRILTEREPG